MSAPADGRDRRRGLGVASLVLALIPIAGLILLFLIGPPIVQAIDDGGWGALTFILFAGGGATFVVEGIAVGLGIAAAAKDRGRIPAIIGIVLSTVILLTILVWVVRNYSGVF